MGMVVSNFFVYSKTLYIPLTAPLFIAFICGYFCLTSNLRQTLVVKPTIVFLELNLSLRILSACFVCNLY